MPSVASGRFFKTSTARRELLRRLRRAEGLAAETGAPQEISRRDDPSRWPLSFAQERLWFLAQLEPDGASLNIPLAVRLRGPLEADALARGLTEVCRRHEVLRAVFRAAGGRSEQRIAPPRPVALPRVDLGALPAAASRSEEGRLRRREALRPFRLDRGPLLRAMLVVRGGDDHVLHLTVHHVVADGWSLGILVRELVDFYAAVLRGERPAVAELPIQYADYAHWQRQRLSGSGRDSLAYWRRQLAGVPPALELPADRPRPAVQSFRGLRTSRTLAAERTEALRALAGKASASPFMVLLAAFKIVLARWSSEEDVVVGSPIAGRTRRELEGLVGLFLNHLVLRTDLSGKPTFLELLLRVRRVALEAYTHQEVPFELLLDELQPQRDLARTPLFQVYFNMLSFPAPETEIPGLAVEGLGVPEAPSKFDLTLYVSEPAAGGLRLELVYNADLFGRLRMEELLAQYELVLEQAVRAPRMAIGRFSLLTPAARSVLPDPAVPLDAGWPGPIHDAALRRARETPDRPAVTWDGGVVTYGRLAAESGLMARRLRGSGAGRGDVVAIWAARDPALAPAVLGVLRIGAAFLLLDPAHPAPRHAACLRQARPRGWVILDSAPPVPAELEGWTKVSAPCRAGSACRSDPLEDSLPAVEVGPADLACVSFTSGSTGEPKGVLGLHRSLTHFLPWQCAEFALTSEDRFSLLSGLAHDPLQRELFTSWWLGAAVAVPDPARLGEPGWLAGWMADLAVTVAHLTPAMGQLLCEAPTGRGRRMPDLRRALFVGEALRRRDVERLRDLAPRAECVNLYGTTETQRAVGYHRTSGDETAEVLPLGRGMPGVQLLVARRGAAGLAGIAELGEISVRSPHLAAGYLGGAKLAAARFTANPFGGSPGDRVYRTGDLGRYLPGGEVAFAGRGDRQVQVRGFRVEPGEVEAMLGELPQVRRAAVLAREEANGDRRLVAYVVAGREPAADGRELAELLGRRLPAHMVPSDYVRLDQLPLTPNRKVDRAALVRLPLPEPARERKEHAATPVEEILAGIWREVLAVDAVTPADDFFALGGHSLKVTRVLARIADALGVELPVRSLFEAPTLAALARRVEESGRTRRLPPLTAEPRDRELPLSFAQQRLLFLGRLSPGSAAYNVPAAVRLRGRLSPAALERALAAEARRQEVLRTTFGEAAGRPVARIHAAVHWPLLPFADLRGLPEGAREAEAEHRVREAARAPFDLHEGPLWQARLFTLGEDDHIFVLTLHHAITDAWSMSVLVREVAALYGGASLPELPVQYADFAAWQQRWMRGEVLAEQLDFWRRQLDGLEPLELATDRPRTAHRSRRAGRLPLALPAALADDLQSLGRRRGATLFMVLLAAFQALLARVSHQPRPAVGTPIANRRLPELEGLVGFFANTLVLAADLAGDPDFDEVLGRAREAALGAYAHQDLPFEKLVEELAPERDRSRSPLFQVMLALDNVPAPPAFPGGLAVTPLTAEAGAARFDLSLTLAEGRGGLAGSLEYDADLFDATTLARFAAHLRTLLTGATADPRCRLTELPLASAAERHQLRYEWSSAAVRLGDRVAVEELFATLASERPEAAALVDGDAHLSYGELHARSGGLARRLQALGVGPDDRVGICLERSAEAVTAVLAVLAAGGAWVPLDPEHPRERLGEIAAQARIRVLVARGELGARCPPPEGATVLRLDRMRRVETGHRDESPPDGANLAYVYFTSGSTGRPKGVMVSRRALTDRFAATLPMYAVGPCDRLVQAVDMSFDPFIEEVFLALAAGGTLVVARRQLVRSGGLGGELLRHRATVASLTPALLAAAGTMELPALSTVGVGGERLSVELAARWARGRRLLNTYGPTETTIFVTSFEMVGSLPAGLPAGGPPIGRPYAGSRVYVLGPRLEPVVAGGVGELLIGGAGLARGYLGQGTETAVRFVPDPLAGGEPGGRLYRTGDRVRWLAGGDLEFLGRLDRQVKVRGFRIELGEIEAALLHHPRVDEAAVVDVTAAGGGARLAAYTAAQGRDVPAADELRAFLAERLPAYMVPAVFVGVAALPRTPSSKVDRGALPSPSLSPDEPYRAPGTTSEAQLAILWSEVLGEERANRRIGVDDDFFELGGHSLAALRLFSRIREVFGVEPPLDKLFELRTIAGLAGELERMARPGVSGAVEAAGRGGPLVRIQPSGSEPPLFFVHPGGGEVLCYAQLARALGPGQPFYGLQAVGLKGEREPLARIDDMAETYLSAVRQVRPSGPYRLGGWSFGGLVAFEMAGRLEREGETVELLALLDTVLGGIGPEADDADLLAEALGEMLGIEAEELRGRTSEEEQLAYLLEQGRKTGRLPEDFRLDQARHVFRVYKANVRAARRYRPRHHSVRATLFRAAVSRLGADDPADGWDEVATSGVEVVTVPGTHHQMVLHPYVETLAASLGRRLAGG